MKSASQKECNFFGIFLMNQLTKINMNKYTKRIDTKWLTTWFAYIVLCLTSLASSYCLAQPVVKGVVYDKQSKAPIAFANVVLKHTDRGTQTDVSGQFQLNCLSSDTFQFVISCVGYEVQTFQLNKANAYYLMPQKQMKEVIITHRRTSSYIVAIAPIKTQMISQQDLQKSACCNLSEAFETNASVDVMVGDALSGTKQLRMMGIDGVYTSILCESQPMIYNQNIPFGLDIIPGTWLKSIALNSGISSAITGHESMSGNINVEFEKPNKGDLLFVNIFGNTVGRLEANVHSAVQFRNNWSGGLYLHANRNTLKVDNNNDNFYDLPMREGFAVMNRWQQDNIDNKTKISLALYHDQKIGGEIEDKTKQAGYRLFNANNTNSRAEVRLAHEWHNDKRPNHNMMITANSFIHQLQSQYGLKFFEGRGLHFNSQLFRQSTLKAGVHNFKYSLSYSYDYTRNQLYYDATQQPTTNQGATQVEPGAALEYTYTPNTTWQLLLSQRIDYNQNFGWQASPRLFFKYRYDEYATLRINAGRGYRIAQPFTDNYNWMANNRTWAITPMLTPEVAWNYGINHTTDFLLKQREGHLSLDVYHTRFIEQMQVNYENKQVVKIEQLNGRSYATILQAEAQWYATKNIEIKLAYRNNIVKTTYSNNTFVETKYMTPRSKTLINVAYSSRFDKWKLTASGIRNGQQRMPDGSYSPAFYNVLAQATRNFKQFSTYVGVENALNFTQANPIEAANDPYSAAFNASEVWGPILGRVVYVGVKFKIK